MPRPKKIVKTTEELLHEARILEENNGVWLAEHVAVVLNLSVKTVYRTPWLRVIRERRGPTLIGWRPEIVRKHYAKQQSPRVQRELAGLRMVG